MGKNSSPQILGPVHLDIDVSVVDDCIRIRYKHLFREVSYEWRVPEWEELPPFDKNKQISLFKLIEQNQMAAGIREIRDKVLKESRIFTESEFETVRKQYLLELVERRKFIEQLETILKAECEIPGRLSESVFEFARTVAGSTRAIFLSPLLDRDVWSSYETFTITLLEQLRNGLTKLEILAQGFSEDTPAYVPTLVSSGRTKLGVKASECGVLNQRECLNRMVLLVSYLLTRLRDLRSVIENPDYDARETSP